MLPVSIVESVEIEDWREDYLLTWTNRKFVAASLSQFTQQQNRGPDYRRNVYRRNVCCYNTIHAETMNILGQR